MCRGAGRGRLRSTRCHQYALRKVPDVALRFHWLEAVAQSFVLYAPAEGEGAGGRLRIQLDGGGSVGFWLPANAT